MAGIIQTSINKKNPFGSISGYEAERVELDPEDTVEQRVQSIINREGPALQSEVTRSQQAANRKGVLNTSMAVGEGERARYDYSLPIASQDSAQSLQTKLSNQAEANKAYGFTAEQTNQAAKQERAGQQELSAIGAQGEVSSRLQREQGAIQSQLQAQQGGISSRLQKELGVINAKAAEIENTYNISADDRALINELAVGAQRIQGEVDRDTYARETQEIVLELANKYGMTVMDAQYVYDARILEQKGEQDVTAMGIQFEGEGNLLRLGSKLNMKEADYQHVYDIVKMDHGRDTEYGAIQLAADLGIEAADAQNLLDMARDDNQAENQQNRDEYLTGAASDQSWRDYMQAVDLDNLDQKHSVALQKLTNKHANLMQTNVGVANIFSSELAALGAIMADPNMTPEAKATQVESSISSVNTIMGAYGGMAGVDIDEIIVTEPEEETEPEPEVVIKGEDSLTPEQAAWREEYRTKDPIPANR